MGWGRWLLLDDIGQQHDLAESLAEIEILKQRLNKATARQSSAVDKLREITAENNELKLYMATVFRLLLDKSIVTREELEALVTAIDREDGTEDKQRRGPVLAT